MTTDDAWEPGHDAERPGCCGDGTCQDDHGRRRSWGVFTWLTERRRDAQAETRHTALQRVADQAAAAGVPEVPTVAHVVTRALTENA